MYLSGKLINYGADIKLSRNYNFQLSEINN